MTTGWLPAPVEELFGPEATAEESYEVLTVDVPPASWTTALETARDALHCTYFDWLSAVDEPGTGFHVSAHVVALSPVRRLLVRTTVPHSAPVLASAVDVYAGAAWHERETHEMFGVTFEGHPGLDPLLLPDGFEGHPLRKDFVLAARVAKAWPGAKEPGESEHGGPKRRQMLPPGVPDPNEWGPLKGQLPPAPARPARGAGRATAGDRPARRARTAGDGSASQAPTAPAATPAATPTPTTPRRARSAGEGSAGQGDVAAGTAAAPRRARSASEGSASQGTEAGTAVSPEVNDTAAESARESSDAPWHHARPAFDEPETRTESETLTEPEPEPEPGTKPEPKAEPKAESERGPRPKPDSERGPAPDPTPTPEDPTGGTQ
ncbi:NADH-quinone oxidoreductase subunit C [Streptomyces sp. NPDC058274]|uniref:NADH-quinone oxidoreductase subunit C n=1 Tax=Streptomyces sp. NPDC058274 TaxID=3346416 RepID=UPI0036E4F116